MELSKEDKLSPSEFCLSYDTEVLTIEHEILPIGKIVESKIECSVYTRHESGIYPQQIEQWHERGEKEVFEYRLDNGATIKATKNHKFMTSDGKMLQIDRIFELGLELMEGESYIVNNLEKAKTPKHTYIAINTAMNIAVELENLLIKSGRFSEDQLTSFGKYIESQYLDYRLHPLTQERKVKNINNQKEIFDYIIANPNLISELVD